MSATCSSDGQTNGTFTPITYQIEQTIENGQNSYTGWLFKGKNTNDFFYSYSPSLGIIGFRSNNDVRAGYEPFHLSTKENSVLEKIETRIFNRLSFPSHWSDEGVAPPSMAAKVRAFAIGGQLFKEYDLIPDRMGPTKEEGLALFYDSADGTRTLLIEVYNDLDVGTLVNDNISRKILASNDIVGNDFREAVALLNG